MVNSLILNFEAELLLLRAENLLELFVGPPDRLALEQAVNLLQWDTGGLGDKEEGEEEGEEGERSEEHVHSVSHGGEHLLGEARDKEVEEPVACGGAGLGEGTEVGVKELGVDDPGSTVPGGGVDSGPEVEEEDGGNTTSVQGCDVVLCGLDNVDVGTDDPHADRTCDGTNEQKLAATELVDQEQQPDNSHNSLDDTEDTSHNVDSVGLDTQRLSGAISKLSKRQATWELYLETYLEDGGGVVVDGVDTRTVLPEEKHASQEQTVAEERPGAKSLEGLPEAHTNGGALFLDSSINSSNFLGDVHVTGSQLTDPAKVVHGLRTLVVQEQPSGGFPHPERAKQQHTGGNQLDGEGDHPLLVVIRDMLLNTILNSQVLAT